MQWEGWVEDHKLAVMIYTTVSPADSCTMQTNVVDCLSLHKGNQSLGLYISYIEENRGYWPQRPRTDEIRVANTNI